MAEFFGKIDLLVTVPDATHVVHQRMNANGLLLAYDLLP
jgi:hypothetical protein